MKIGGLIKTSLIDYPGKTSCVVFSTGCNFSCSFCHNPDLVTYKAERLKEKYVLDFLKKRVDFLDGVVVSGGEATLQNDIVSFCRKIKNMGYKIKLDTNGSRPHVIGELIKFGLIDYIAMDVKTNPGIYSLLTVEKNIEQKITKSIFEIMGSGIPYEFRTTCAEPFVDMNIIRDIGRIIRGAELYALQQFNDVNVLKKNGCWGCPMGDIKIFKTIAGNYVKKCITR